MKASRSLDGRRDRGRYPGTGFAGLVSAATRQEAREAGPAMAREGVEARAGAARAPCCARYHSVLMSWLIPVPDLCMNLSSILT